MGYTPVELRHVHVARRPWGYHRDGVQKVLDDVADSFEIVWRDRGELADRVEQLEQEVEALKAREQALANTLVTAERAAAETKAQAQRQADLILSEAHAEARAVLRDAHGERERLLAEVRRIEGLMRSALAMIGTSEAEPARETAAEAARVEDAPARLAPAAPPPELPRAEEPPTEVAEPSEGAESPGWPPLRRVAQARRDFDWGD
jgi:cell division initiation protein